MGEWIPEGNQQSLPQKKSRTQAEGDWHELGLGVRGCVCEEEHFPKRGIVEHWTLTLIFEKKICTPISLENDAHFIYLYLEIDQAQQHIDGSDKSCRIESDRLLNHYCFPNFQDQKTILCIWPTRPLLPFLSDRVPPTGTRRMVNRQGTPGKVVDYLSCLTFLLRF